LDELLHRRAGVWLFLFDAQCGWDLRGIENHSLLMQGNLRSVFCSLIGLLLFFLGGEQQSKAGLLAPKMGWGASPQEFQSFAVISSAFSSQSAGPGVW